MDDKYNDRAYDTILSLAYYILSEQQFPIGLQFNLEGENHGKKDPCYDGGVR